MLTTVATQITINKNIDKVFAYLADLKYHHLWNPHMVALSTKEPLHLGMTYRAESRLLGITITATNEVTRLTPPYELEVVNKRGNVQYRARFTLAEQTNTTLVQIATEVSTDIVLMDLTLPALRKLALHELRTDLRALKRAVEQNLT